MRFKFNRIAILPKQCTSCKQFVWLEKYRRADVYHIVSGYHIENICKDCIDKYLPKQEEKKECLQ